jgi:hypothetical protein
MRRGSCLKQNDVLSSFANFAFFVVEKIRDLTAEGRERRTETFNRKGRKGHKKEGRTGRA